MARVREMLDRSRKSLLDGTARQRLEGSTKQLLERSRSTVAQFVGAETAADDSSQEVLAGVCSSVALRDLNIVDSLLELLEQLEVDEQDPDALAKLYKLDHLATRLRRNSENLRVLAGREAGGGREENASLVDVIRAGMSAIEHYSRVDLGKVAGLDVAGFAADDVSRLLAELLDNATTYSPPTSEVTVSAHLTEQGSVLVRVEDSGIGLPAARLSALNEQLSGTPRLDRSTVQHMGLAVVRRLAAGHNIRVWLARRAPHGTTASVLLPAPLVRSSQSSGWRSGQSAPSAARSTTPAARTPAVGTSAATASTGTTAPGTSSAPSTAVPENTSSTARAAETGETSSSGLPRRVPRSGRSQQPEARETGPEGTAEGTGPEQDGLEQTGPAESGPQAGEATTVNGLPRRVPRSLKDSGARGSANDGAEPAWPPPRQDGVELSPEQRRASHEQLLADLGEFAEGEQAAQAAQRADPPGGHRATGEADSDSESEPPLEGRDK